jgi:hypothetical protein
MKSATVDGSVGFDFQILHQSLVTGEEARRHRIELVDVDAENFQRLARADNVKPLAMNRDSKSW